MIKKAKTTKRLKKVAKETERSFCVINHATPYAGGRTIKNTEKDAIEHAKSLIRNENNRGKQTTLYVVEIVKIVTTGDIPVTIHDPKDWVL